MEFFVVGHTHNVVDQRFSVVGPVLKAAQVLETPSDFMNLIKERVRPGICRDLQVEIMQATHDWKAFFEHLGVAISGLTSTFQGEEVCHVWRCVRRVDISRYSKAVEAEWNITVPEDWGHIRDAQPAVG
jgi:hypothetical protein